MMPIDMMMMRHNLRWWRWNDWWARCMSENGGEIWLRGRRESSNRIGTLIIWSTAQKVSFEKKEIKRLDDLLSKRPGCVLLSLFLSLGTSSWSTNSATIISLLAILYLEFSSPATTRCFTSHFEPIFSRRVLCNDAFQIITSRARLREWSLRTATCTARCRHATHTTANSKEHLSEFTLDSWLTGWRALSALNSLRKRRVATFAVNFLLNA